MLMMMSAEMEESRYYFDAGFILSSLARRKLLNCNVFKYLISVQLQLMVIECSLDLAYRVG